jgi:hypothetical protein
MMSIEQKKLREVKLAIRDELSKQIFEATAAMFASGDEQKNKLLYQMKSFAAVQTQPLTKEQIIEKAKELKVIR